MLARLPLLFVGFALAASTVACTALTRPDEITIVAEPVAVAKPAAAPAPAAPAPPQAPPSSGG